MNTAKVFNILLSCWGLFMTSCGGSPHSHSSQDSLVNSKPSLAKKAVVIAKSGLTLRNKPQESYFTTTLLPYNTIVDVLEQTDQIETHQGIMGKWYKVSYQNKQGYAFGGYLKIGTELSPLQATAPIEKIFDTDMQGVIQRALVNIKGGLMLRKLPGTASESLLMIPQDEEVGILNFLKNTEVVEAQWGSWCKVRFRTQEGYLFSGFLTFTSAKVVNASGAGMRANAAYDSKMLLRVEQGKEVFIVNRREPLKKASIGGVSGVWYQVKYQRKQGYIFSPDLKIEGY